MRIISAIFLLIACNAALAADFSIRSESSRTVMRRGETIDIALHARAPQAVPEATVEFLINGNGVETGLATDTLTDVEAGPFDLTYRIDTGSIAVGTYQLIGRLTLGDQTEQAAMPLEIAANTKPTDFKIHYIGMPRWVLPTGNTTQDVADYNFNFLLANINDQWGRSNRPGLSGQDRALQDIVRYGFDFLKYPTGFGWGLAHRPIRGGASWCDPKIIDISAQLMQYHTQGCRRFPSFAGMNPIDEPGVSYIDKWMAEDFKRRTGMEAPQPDEKDEDLDRYVAYQVYRNHVLNYFHQTMKEYMREVDPDALMTSQTFADILTDAGLYPSGNVFQDVQSTHTYDHWPTSNNWISFDVNLRRANRKVFWDMPLYTVAGCYGIMPDQWRASWALGMSAKLDGFGYFLGAGELPEHQAWSEFSLAEMVRINRLDTQYGNFFLTLEKPVTPLALWYSLAQSAAADASRQYPHEVIAAYYALKRAHFPVTIVTDEDLRAGLLQEHDVLLVVDANYVPTDLRTAIDDFTANGGKLVADRTTKAFPEATSLGTDFREFAAIMGECGNAWKEGRQETSMNVRRDIFAERGVIRHLPIVEEALEPLVERTAWAGSPDTFVDVQYKGDARYVFIANEASVYRHPNVNERWITMQESVRATDTITMPFAKGKAVYDLWSGKRLQLDESGSVTLDLAPADLRVLCVYPQPVQNTKLTVKSAASWPGTIQVSTQPAPGNSGVVPAYFELKDPRGTVVLKQYASVDLAQPTTWSYDLAANDLAGDWTATVTNTLADSSSTVKTTIASPKAEGTVIAQRLNSVVVFDERAYPAFAKRTPIYVVPGKENVEAAVKLAEVLDAEVRQPDDIRKMDNYSDFLDPEKNKGVWMMPRWKPLCYTTGANLVLLGTPDTNLLIRDMNESGVMPRLIHSSTIGKGEAIVEYVWSPYDLGKDVVVIGAYDQAGIEAGCDRFLQVANLQNTQQIANATPLVSTISQKPEAEPVGEAAAIAEILEKIKLADGVRKLAAGGGIVAAGTMDGRLSVFDYEGKQLWQREFDYRVIGVDVSPDGKFVAAAAFPRTYVFDRDGVLQFVRLENVPSRDDVEGLAVRSGDVRLVRGTWTSRIDAHNPDGSRAWQYPAPAPEKKEGEQADAEPAKQPDPTGPVRAIAVLPDGSSAVGGLQYLVVLDKDGKETFRKKMDRLQDVTAIGDQILAASFKKKLMLLNRDGSVAWQADTPHFIMAADASADGTVIAAALFDGRVLTFDKAGKLVSQRALPLDVTLTGIDVSEDGTSMWISTWEGDLIKIAN